MRRASTAKPCEPAAALDRMVDVIVAKYAPLPERTLSDLTSRLRLGAPQWAAEARAAFVRAKARLPSARVDGITWYWPAARTPASRRHADDAALRLLAPFDPVVWDRRRFETFWGWAYRFEAYTPAPQRVRGYYALPMLWQGRVIGLGQPRGARRQAARRAGLRGRQGAEGGRLPPGAGRGTRRGARFLDL